MGRQELARPAAPPGGGARRGPAIGSSDGSTVAPRLIIVASARTGYDQLESLMAQLRDRRQVLDIRLAPLVESETRELIALRLNCQPEELSDDLVARVHALCGGNPFFVAETVRDWYEKDAITRSESGWVLATEATDTSDLPETVRDVMRLRLQGLPPKVQQVVSAAAVIGAVVDIDLLREVLPDLSESDVLDAIDLLLPRRVFRETGNAGPRRVRARPASRATLRRSVGDAAPEPAPTCRRAAGKPASERPGRRRRRAGRPLPQCRRRSQGIRLHDGSGRGGARRLRVQQRDRPVERRPEALARGRRRATRYRLWEMLGIAYGSSGRLDDAIAAYQQALEHAGGPHRAGDGPLRDRRGVPPQGPLRRTRSATSTSPCARWGTRAPQRYPGASSTMLWASRLLPPAALSALDWPAEGLTPTGGSRSRSRPTFASGPDERDASLFDYIAQLVQYRRPREAVEEARTTSPWRYSKIGLNCGLFSLESARARASCRSRRRWPRRARRHEVQAMVRAHVGTVHYFAGRLDEAEADLARGRRDSRQGRGLTVGSSPITSCATSTRFAATSPVSWPRRRSRSHAARRRVATQRAWPGDNTVRPTPSPGPVSIEEAHELVDAARSKLFARPEIAHPRTRLLVSSASSASRRRTIPGAAAPSNSRGRPSSGNFCLIEFAAHFPVARREPARPALGRRRRRAEPGHRPKGLA